MSFHVEGEVVGSAEGALALAAAEGLLTRVLPEMSSQLVGPRELPGAAVPRALVRFFPWKQDESVVPILIFPRD